MGNLLLWGLYGCAVIYTYRHMQGYFSMGIWQCVFAFVFAIPFCILRLSGLIVLGMAMVVSSGGEQSPSPAPKSSEAKKQDPRTKYENPYAFVSDEEERD